LVLLILTQGQYRSRTRILFDAGPGSAAMTIKETRDHKKPDRGMVVEALEVFNQRGETVLACEHLLLAKRRGG